jgi:hypothetical protein
MRRLLFAAVLGGLALVADPFANTAAAGGAIACAGNITNTTINSDVYVPMGAECDVWDATINGNVTVHSNGDFDIVDATVKGSVSASNAYDVFMRRTTVGGSVTVNGGTTKQAWLFQCPRIAGNLTITGLQDSVLVKECEGGTPPRVLGNVTLSNNGKVFFHDAIVSGSVLVSGNNGWGWGMQNNTIGGTLNCYGNADGQWGGNNTAKAKLGQCAGL